MIPSRQCEWCGVAFFKRPSCKPVTFSRQRFCSRECGYANRTTPFAELFWAKVQKGDGCWLWTAAKFPNGYGHMRHSGRSMLTHRVAWELVNGPIPDGLIVCHRCDVHGCARPDHLFLGTHHDNSMDMVAKGRHSKKGAPGIRKRFCECGEPLSIMGYAKNGGAVRRCRPCTKTQMRAIHQRRRVRLAQQRQESNQINASATVVEHDGAEQHTEHLLGGIQ